MLKRLSLLSHYFIHTEKHMYSLNHYCSSKARKSSKKINRLAARVLASKNSSNAEERLAGSLLALIPRRLTYLADFSPSRTKVR